jgi:hypothetical protein
VTEVFLTLTEIFPSFFLGCKANARVKLANTWHGPHSSTLVVICVVLYVPSGDNPFAVNKYIISYRKGDVSRELLFFSLCGRFFRGGKGVGNAKVSESRKI